MIAGMMDGLEQKLGKDSRDLEGWKRLIRAGISMKSTRRRYHSISP
jgi:hypothetical protein